MEHDDGLLSVHGEIVLSRSPELEATGVQWVPTDDGQYEGRFDAFATFRSTGTELADTSRTGMRVIAFPIADIPNLIAQLTEVRTTAMRAGLLRRTK